MIRSFVPTSRVRLGQRVAANNTPQIAPYSTTSSPYAAPPSQTQQRQQGSAPRPPGITQAAQNSTQGSVSRTDTGRPFAPPALGRTAFAPGMGRQPETPPQAPVQPQPGWSASNEDKDPIWRNTWRSSGEGLWGQNAPDNAGGYPIPPGMTPRNIDRDRLAPPRDIGLQRAGRPSVTYTPPAVSEPGQELGAIPDATPPPNNLGGGLGPAGSAPPADQNGIGVNISGLSAADVGEHAEGNDPTGEEAGYEENLGDRSDKYSDVSDGELDQMIEDAQSRPVPGGVADPDLLAELLTEKRRREAAGSARAAAGPSDEYVASASEGSGVPPDQIRQDYEDGYRWAQDETGEWKRYNYEEMLDAFLSMYDPEDGNPYMNAIWEDLQAGRPPDPNDLALAQQEYNDDEHLDAWRRFRGETKAEIEERGGYGKSGGSGEGSDTNWSAEMEALLARVNEELGREFEPFDESALRASSALDRSQQMRSALELAGAQGAAPGQVQSAISDIGLRSETALNAEVADKNMASQIAKHQRNMGLIAQAASILLAQQSQALSADEAAKNRELQLLLARMGMEQQQRMDAIAAERERNRTFWDSLGGVFGGLLGLGGTLGGAYLGRPSYPDFRLP